MKEEDTTNDSALNNSTLEQFRSSLSQFSFDSPPKNELRRSPRKPVPIRSSTGSPVKRLASESGLDTDDVKDPKISSRQSSRAPKKQKRTYAPPETYAHLRELQDHLKPDLDVIFCGINPGKKSAELGHHFGNPSNHFWWCLHHSGFTPTQLRPQEDFNLPDRFSLGLTNLVDRPTSEQMELSGSEQLASVPGFLAKIARYRPCVVCFVGLSIAKVVDASLNVTLNSAKSWGLRPYKMVHQNPSMYAETLFFAAPSTSGLVTQFQRPDKARILGEMKRLVEDVKAGRDHISTTAMTVIQPHQIAQTPEPPEFSNLLSFSSPVKVEQGSSSDLGGEKAQNDQETTQVVTLFPSREDQS